MYFIEKNKRQKPDSKLHFFNENYITGLPHCQENQEKEKKRQNSGKVRRKWGFLKISHEKSGNLI